VMSRELHTPSVRRTSAEVPAAVELTSMSLAAVDSCGELIPTAAARRMPLA
jgi:hypothetical protein